MNNNKDIFIESLDCAQKAIKNIEQSQITQLDINNAMKIFSVPNEASSQAEGLTLKVDYLCALLPIMHNVLQNSDVTTNEELGEYFIEELRNTPEHHILSPNFLGVTRIIEKCEVTTFVNLDFNKTEALTKIFDSYSNYIMFNTCTNKEVLKDIEAHQASDFSMLSYEEAIAEMNKVLGEDSAPQNNEL